MRVVVAPPVPALLSRYASLADPVADLRAASLDAVTWLLEDSDATVVADSAQAREVGEELLGLGRRLSTAGLPASSAQPRGEDTDERTRLGGPGLLVMANGSARRSEKAPGHLDERSFAFDDALEAVLSKGDADALGSLDVGLGAELLACVGPLPGLADLTVTRAVMDYADDPFGVRYWVVRWECAS